MKLIDKMLIEYQPVVSKLYMAMITVLNNDTVDMLCYFYDAFSKEIGRKKKNFIDRHETARVLKELTKQYPDDERPAIIINNIAEVMQRAPA